MRSSHCPASLLSSPPLFLAFFPFSPQPAQSCALIRAASFAVSVIPLSTLPTRSKGRSMQVVSGQLLSERRKPLWEQVRQPGSYSLWGGEGSVLHLCFPGGVCNFTGPHGHPPYPTLTGIGLTTSRHVCLTAGSPFMGCVGGSLRHGCLARQEWLISRHGDRCWRIFEHLCEDITLSALVLGGVLPSALEHYWHLIVTISQKNVFNWYTLRCITARLLCSFCQTLLYF